MQSYVSNDFTDQVMNEWVMSTIEDPELSSSMKRLFKSWRRREKLKYDQCAAGSREINNQT